MVPEARLRAVNEAPIREDGEHVLYWMIAARRSTWSFGLERAARHAGRLKRPLVVLEALRAGHRWANDRMHRFVLEGMRDQRAAFAARRGVLYHPYVEPRPGDGRGLLEALAARACVVVTDDFPVYFLPRMVAAAGRRLDVRLEAVDGNGLMPMAAPGREFTRAHDLRRHLQKTLREHLGVAPEPDPLALLPRGLPAPALPAAVLRRWPAATDALLAATTDALGALPIDHAVGPGLQTGGPVAAAATLARFLERGLARYADERDQPSADVTSGLSPYLHWGHVSAHEVVRAALDLEGWTPDRLGTKTDGAREGWWGVRPTVEAWLDQVVTWRELGFINARMRDDLDRCSCLPAWAVATLEKHRKDTRSPCYDLATLEAARTYDPLWNAAQTQLLREGRMHNYLRMLWGKKVLEWSPTPEAALEALVHLNDRWAIDGRDPNSYSGITWCLGRYDRAWGPERKVFGTVRYMSSDNTARKLRVKEYLAEYG